MFDTHSLVEPLLAADKKIRIAIAENKKCVTVSDGVIVKK